MTRQERRYLVIGDTVDALVAAGGFAREGYEVRFLGRCSELDLFPSNPIDPARRWIPGPLPHDAVQTWDEHGRTVWWPWAGSHWIRYPAAWARLQAARKNMAVDSDKKLDDALISIFGEPLAKQLLIPFANTRWGSSISSQSAAHLWSWFGRVQAPPVCVQLAEQSEKARCQAAMEAIFNSGGDVLFNTEIFSLEIEAEQIVGAQTDYGLERADRIAMDASPQQVAAWCPSIAASTAPVPVSSDLHRLMVSYPKQAETLWIADATLPGVWKLEADSIKTCLWVTGELQVSEADLKKIGVVGIEGHQLIAHGVPTGTDESWSRWNKTLARWGIIPIGPRAAGLYLPNAPHPRRPRLRDWR